MQACCYVRARTTRVAFCNGQTWAHIGMPVSFQNSLVNSSSTVLRVIAPLYRSNTPGRKLLYGFHGAKFVRVEKCHIYSFSQSKMRQDYPVSEWDILLFVQQKCRATCILRLTEIPVTKQTILSCLQRSVLRQTFLLRDRNFCRVRLLAYSFVR